jgi:hypothetical protein
VMPSGGSEESALYSLKRRFAAGLDILYVWDMLSRSGKGAVAGYRWVGRGSDVLTQADCIRLMVV